MTEHITAKEYLKAKPKKLRKYRNQPIEIDGIRFPSKLQAGHHQQLKLLQKAGKIERLKHEPRYPIHVKGVLICTVVPDHSFYERVETDCGMKLVWRVADSKSKPTITSTFRLKAKLFRVIYGVEIEVWTKPQIEE